MAKFEMSLSDMLDAYVTIEETLRSESISTLHQQDIRDIGSLVSAIEAYTGYNIRLFESDFYDLPNSDEIGRSRDFYSFVHIFEGAERKAEVNLNSHMLDSDTPLVNFCWRRFCIVKEAVQIVIRHQYLERNADSYPGTVSENQTNQLLHNLFRFKFSLADFDNPSYPDDVKVENAAELVAVLLLYPIDKMVRDQHELLKRINGGNVGVYDSAYIDYAEQYRVPERYVDLFLSHEDLSEMYAVIRGKTDVFPIADFGSVGGDGEEDDESDNDGGFGPRTKR